LVATIVASGGRASVGVADITEVNQVKKCFEEVRSTFGPTTILLHCAAARGNHVGIANTSEEEWSRVAFTALDGAFLTSQAALGQMLERSRGRIIFVSGPASHLGQPAGSTHGAVSKAGLEGLARAIAQEYGPLGVTANVVTFGMFDDDQSREPDMARRSISRPEAASLILDMCRLSFAAINGATIMADSGLTV
jgi:NAD(P)-dependent dehydrogenase (short-subunit alcohol dehydrogenase family)